MNFGSDRTQVTWPDSAYGRYCRDYWRSASSHCRSTKTTECSICKYNGEFVASVASFDFLNQSNEQVWLAGSAFCDIIIAVCMSYFVSVYLFFLNRTFVSLVPVTINASYQKKIQHSRLLALSSTSSSGSPLRLGH